LYLNKYIIRAQTSGLHVYSQKHNDNERRERRKTHGCGFTTICGITIIHFFSVIKNKLKK